MKSNLKKKNKIPFSTIENRKIRAAIVGCGRISKKHFEAIEKHKENIELLAICEIELQILNEYKTKQIMYSLRCTESVTIYFILPLTCIFYPSLVSLNK